MSPRFAMAMALLGVVLLAIPVSAQTPDSVLAPLVSKSPFVRLRTEGAPVTGRLIASSPGVATLQPEGSIPRAIPLTSVDSIWVRGNAAKAGAVVGGALLAVLGAVAARSFALGVCETDDCNEGGAAFLGGAVGAVSGALIGAGVGSL